MSHVESGLPSADVTQVQPIDPTPSSTKPIDHEEPTDMTTPNETATSTTAIVSPDSEDAALLWGAIHGEQWAYDSQMQIWRWYNPDLSYWQEVTGPIAIEQEQQIQNVLVRIGMKRMKNRVEDVRHMAQTSRHRLFDPRPDLINFANGTLEVAHMQLRQHNPADNLTYCYPYIYRPGHYPTIARFLETTIDDPVGRQSLMCHIGLAMLADTSQQKALAILGPSGTGKSTLLDLINLTCGYGPKEYASAALFGDQSRNANSRASWSQRRIVCLDEFPSQALSGAGEDMLKSMIAHGGVAKWKLYKEEQARNQWQPKLVFATNNLPYFNDPAGAFNRRFVFIACSRKLAETEMDGHLLDKLIPDLPGFAAACIEAALQVLETGVYPESAAMKALKREIEISGNPLKQFMDEWVIREPEAWTLTDDVYSVYLPWHACNFPGSKPMSKSQFSRAIITIGSPTVKAAPRNRGRGLQGLRLRAVTDSESNPEIPAA